LSEDDSFSIGVDLRSSAAKSFVRIFQQTPNPLYRFLRMTNAQSRKTRTLSLRLSEQEFEALKSLYTAHGARSMSEFARAAVQTVITSRSDRAALELRLQEIDTKLSLLDSEVARLSQIIRALLAERRSIA
jgi:hypothetical protein